MLPQDTIIIDGLKGNDKERRRQQEALYRSYDYFIKEGCRNRHLSYDDSFSAYQDAFTSAIDNIVNNRFDGHSSLKTYLYKIFDNKCIDLVRRNATNKNEVHKASPLPEMLITQLPDNVKSIVEGIMTRELFDQVKARLNRLSKKCKDILLLYEDGLTDKEIAEHLSYNNAAVAKTTRLRCLEKLKSDMPGR